MSGPSRRSDLGPTRLHYMYHRELREPILYRQEVPWLQSASCALVSSSASPPSPLEYQYTLAETALCCKRESQSGRACRALHGAPRLHSRGPGPCPPPFCPPSDAAYPSHC